MRRGDVHGGIQDRGVGCVGNSGGKGQNEDQEEAAMAGEYGPSVARRGTGLGAMAKA